MSTTASSQTYIMQQVKPLKTLKQSKLECFYYPYVSGHDGHAR